MITMGFGVIYKLQGVILGAREPLGGYGNHVILGDELKLGKPRPLFRLVVWYECTIVSKQTTDLVLLGDSCPWIVPAWSCLYLCTVVRGHVSQQCL
ncbi:hypothetical protein HanRHA438_Chr03g0116681 [Helianthus annuus]|uniref:Uncharacterized protein n=1 Tax=Helianthus annuus TaxID=4232 RepID=A0A251UNR3_HELAN|nr:hypothetical protein HanXRQr2_Chr03g0105951 [Helianthus annuus]KAJ0592713.1 hypothetical protein HanHA300_Chr03g0088361 [Helianthus annuus]KAJ0600359.1 hypothetical protein HanIR_Chr03g0115711 [Helianthus annuus]KAJ0607712.1 hypothetical protein HanHA89_Chr03g0099951 [Helianthus annuus]KAJ0767777.1 hypothetical protein HanLR1_Chr03g0093331 [Helianthus annuus]